MGDVGVLLLDEDRLRVLRELAAEVANIDGCVVELGVYCGGSALVLATCLPGRKLHLFDTFAGLPETDEIDRHVKGEFAGDEAAVRALLGFWDVEFHVGVFPETMPEGIGPVALAHCDCDLYAGTAAFIREFRGLMAKGGAMVFDDFGSPACPGVTRAVEEAFAPWQVLKPAASQCVVRF